MKTHYQKRKTLPSSASTTPPMTPKSSTYPSEDEDEDEDDESDGNKAKHFEFLNLPSELRNKIYGCVFSGTPSVIDLDPDNSKLFHRKFLIFLVCRQISDEASHHFYSAHTFRLFPTHPGKFFKSKKPLLARLSTRNRASISTIQLRLGPGFLNPPPPGWAVNDALGLRDTVNVRILQCYVEIDPSAGFLAGYRGFNYAQFTRKLLQDVLREVPSITEMQFDGYPSVKKNGDMMRGLIDIAEQQKKIVSWGPERGWGNIVGYADSDELVKQMEEMVLSKETVPFAKMEPSFS